MAVEEEQQTTAREPRGFGEHARGLSGEYAHEQGWGLNVDERTRPAKSAQDTDGGGDYEYGARDFGDEPVNTAIPMEARDRTQNSPAAKSNGGSNGAQSD